jgi:ABC-type bacteriocin/lantibiotic exporter with double-glycine peptidase domain
MIGESDWPRNQALRLEGVTVRRGAATILEGLDLSFEPGRRYVLIGASGSGKSTLLRLLNRLEDPAGGRLAIGDRPLLTLPSRAVRKAVGLVFQSPRPLPGTLLENLAYPFLVRDLKRPDPSRLVRALEEVGRLLDPSRRFWRWMNQPRRSILLPPE